MQNIFTPRNMRCAWRYGQPWFRTARVTSSLFWTRSSHFMSCRHFGRPMTCSGRVEDRMRAIAAEDLAPWWKLGNVVFRAMEVEDRGAVIHVAARVKDDVVARA